VVLTRSVLIARAREDVFAYVADARNDREWCPKVLSVQQVEGDGPGPGARYTVAHRPVPFRPARQMDDICLSWTPPTRIEWREDDGTDIFVVTYALASVDGATRFTQRSDATLGAPALLAPLIRVGIGHKTHGNLSCVEHPLGRFPG
jgi:hypothetical protein